jgi:hypothetical protein
MATAADSCDLKHLKSNPMIKAVITPERTRIAIWAKNTDICGLLI